jgi:hypothetical protein
MLELKQIECKVVKFRLQPNGQGFVAFFEGDTAVENAITQASCQVVESMDWVHAVFDFSGWFAATAGTSILPPKDG